MIHCMWNAWPHVPQSGGQSSPGYLTPGQQASNGMRQIPQTSSSISHFHTATPCQRLTFIFISITLNFGVKSRFLGGVHPARGKKPAGLELQQSSGLLIMRFLTLFSLVVGVSSQKAGTYTLEAQADQITALPGLAPDVFAGFSGYLAINGTAPGSKKMHYWLQESLNAPLTGRFLICSLAH